MTDRAVRLGFAFALLSALCFSGTTISAVVSYQGGATPVSVITVRTFFTIGALYFFIRLSGATVRLPPRDRYLSLALGLLIGSQSYTIFAAVERLPVALVTLILYLFPLMTGVAAHFLGQGRMTWRLGIALVVAFLGLALALDVTGNGLDGTGLALAFAAAVLMVVVALTTAPLVARIGDSRPVTFHVHISSAAGFLLASLILGEFPLPETTRGWAGFVAVSLFYATAITAYFGAVRLIGPVRSGLVMNIEPVSSIIMGFVVLSQALSSHQLIGAALVIGAIVAAEIRLPSRRAATDP